MVSAFEAEMVLQLIDVGKQVLVFGIEVALVLLVLEHTTDVIASRFGVKKSKAKKK